MASDSGLRRLWPWALLAALACGGEQRPFPLRGPLLVDGDRRPFSPAPEPYVSPFAWDAADQTVFRPISRFFAVDPAGPAINVNALDEVPDSSWFENRIGRAPMTAEQLIRGPCGDQVLDPDMKPGSWIIDQGKPNGANPGFRVNIPGLGKFMLKADPKGEPDRATGATAIAARFYHAAGYNAPCDSVVYFQPEELALKPGLEFTDNSGVTRPFDKATLDKVLEYATHRDGKVRMGASRWLPGEVLGPYRYEGTRDDDPNDVVPHEDRRELRGGRLLAAWLNHFDSREQNTMDVFISEGGGERAPGYVRHYILDLGDCFGSAWEWDEISRRLGHAYYLDIPYMVEDFVSLGTIERPWERAKRDAGIFNYFSARDFEPEAWRPGYPNPAFGRMTEADGAWMARIIARFDDELVAAAVSVGQYDPQSSAYLTRVLIARRDAILRRYLTRLSPIADLRVEDIALCGRDLARHTAVVPFDHPGFSARLGDARLEVHRRDGGDFCVTLPHVAEGKPEYLVVELADGHTHGGLRVHLYDLGRGRGFRLVGIERR